MKYLRCSLIITQFILLSFLACVTHYSTTGKGRIVVNEMTNIKAQPSLNAVDIATVDRGTNLVLVEKKEAWYKVKLPNGLFGWIHESLVLPETFKVVVLNREVEMRYRPDRYAAVMMIIPRGSQIKELERSGDWVKIQATDDNTIGWAPRGIIDAATVVNVETEGGISLYTNSGANIRTGPGRQYDKITTVVEGTRLTWIKTVSDWFHVRLPSGKDGYIWMQLVTNPPYRNVFNTKACDVTSSPSINSITVDRLDESFNKLKVLDTRNGWYLVELPNGSLAWINSNNTSEPTTSVESIKLRKSGLPFGLYFAITDANVYSNQAGSGQIVGSVSPGMHLKVKNSTYDWCEVELSDGAKGYLSRNAFTGVKGKYLVTKDNIHFRERPGTNYPIIDTRDVGLNAILLDVENDWCRVVFENDRKEGWIWSHLLLPSKYRIIYVTEQNANVRSSKDLNNPPIERYDSGTEIPYVEKSGEWYKFNPLVPNFGPVAWLHEKVASVPKYGYGISIREGAIRIGARENYDAIYNLKIGQELPLIDRTGSWYRVEMPDTPRLGYVRREFLRQASYKPLITIIKTEVRTANSLNSRVVVPIEPGTELIELQKQTDWHQVKVIDVERNYYGWVLRSTVVTSNYGNITVSSGKNLRYGPGQEYSVLTTVSGRKEYKILDYDGNWYQIEFNNLTGWIYKNNGISNGEG